MPLSYEQMAELVRRNVSGEAHVNIIDVRERDEIIETGLIPTATNVPVDEIVAAVDLPVAEYAAKYGAEKPSKDSETVLYCLKGMRSDRAAAALKEAGYTAIDTYPGSWNEWSARTKE